MLRRLGKLHDWITELGLRLGSLAICGVVLSYWYEITARYLFNAPTTWASDVVSYLLSASIFLIIPALTKRHEHINIPIVVDLAKAAYRRSITVGLAIVSSMVCVITAFISGTENYEQIVGGVTTMATHPVPKWWITVFPTYGFLSSGIYFLRAVFDTGGRLERQIRNS